ncbi:hypothetical protein BGZ96_006527 [Linnemannia gamsii]|uniref:Uncharacterized protein n=1 Tax=Linnemannia gamsii TaxID=64522 RepID=A0ABQ7K3K3_9FUNG|nr:hypothetical protein BGZ96_006527 [Linnemannia gamsii]
MVSYSGLQIWQHDQLVKEIEIPAEVLIDLDDKTTQMILFSQLGVQIAACLGITLLTWRLYSEFGWLVFQKLEMMKEYRLLFTLLKLDAFFFFGYAIQVAALTDKHWQKGLEEIAFAIPLSGVIILLGFCATLTGDESTDPYFFSRKTMTVFAALTLFMTVLALVYAIVMLYNFNKGLKEAMQQYRVRRSGTIRSVTPSTRRASVNGGAGGYGTTAGGGGGSLQNSHHGSAAGLGGSGDVNVIESGGRRMSNYQSNGGISGMVGHGPGFSGGNGASGGGGGGRRSSKRVSRRSLLHCESTVAVPAMVERWHIE